jgi:hypothetical protein
VVPCAAPEVEERFLHNFLGGLTAADHPQRDPARGPDVAVVYDEERVVIAKRNETHQLGVRPGHRHGGGGRGKTRLLGDGRHDGNSSGS